MTGSLLSWPVEPCPRFLVGFPGLGLAVGTCLVVVGGFVVVAAGLTAGFGGMYLVPALLSTDGI